MKHVTSAALLFLVIVAATGLAMAGETVPALTIVSPGPGITLASDTVGVVVAYRAPEDGAIACVELVVDGAVVQSIPLDPPERRGALDLTWEAASFPDGKHQLAVRAIDTNQQVTESQVTVSLHRGLPSAEARPRVVEPVAGATVAGVTPVEVEVTAAQVKYVVFLVDNVFKAMSNIRPFAYNWDTTRYLNGLHLLQAKAYLADGTESLSQPVAVQVDNPSGMTVARSSAPASKAATSPARTAEPSLPPAIHTESPTPYGRGVAVADAEFGPPGTAPYVSETGDLTQPPTSPLATRVETAQPLEVVGLLGTVAQTEVPTQSVALSEVPVSVAVPSPRQIAVLPAKLARDGFGPPDTARYVSDPNDLVQPPMTPVAARTEEAWPTEIAALPAPVLEQPSAPITAPVAPAAVPATGSPGPAATCAPAVKPAMAPPSVPAPSARQLALLPPKLTEANPAAALRPPPTAAPGIYTVQTGDSLWAIAARHGLTVQQLAKANGVTASSAVRPGQQLRIPAPMIYVNGDPLTSDVPPAIAGGRLLAPFRAVAERAGWNVVWEPETRRAKADAPGREIAVTVGSNLATVDGKSTPMGAAAVVSGDRTLVPLRFLSEALVMVLHYRDGVVRVAEGE